MTSIPDLLGWARTICVPTRSNGKPKKVRFTTDGLVPSVAFHTDCIRAEATTRRIAGEAVAIDSVLVASSREGFRALGLALLGYALSEQANPLRLQLSPDTNGLAQIILWPGLASSLEVALGCRLAITEVRYRPKLFYDNPHYTTVDQDDAHYPREHLPYCSLGAADVERGGVTRSGEPICLHMGGTTPSTVWLGKFLLNLGLEDNNCRMAYLYNYNPAQSLAPGSAELRLAVEV
jgi:hypothetical protein